MEVKVYQERDAYYAVIGDGWWIAWGATPEAAKQAVIKQYRNEMEKLG